MKPTSKPCCVRKIGQVRMPGRPKPILPRIPSLQGPSRPIPPRRPAF